MTQYHPITPGIRKEIADAVGPENVLEQGPALEEYDHDASDVCCLPELVVRVRRPEEIQRLLRLANRHRFPVIPRGAGTGLAGGCLSVCGGVVMSLAEMNRIRRIDTADMIAEVEPGVITRDLREAARAQGLFYPPDPASLDESTIGGNAATNAGGPACVKYGTTQSYILGLEAVLPNGEMIRTGVQTRKGVVGYDMTHLIVGAEGTLAVITGLTLRLIPHPEAVVGFAAVFEDLHTSMQAVTAVMVRGHLPSAVEFMDHKCLQRVGDLLPFQVTGEKSCLVIFELDGPAAQIAAEIEGVKDFFRKSGAAHILSAPDEEKRRQMWEVRRQVSLRVKEEARLYAPEDVAVPVSRIADLVDALPELETRYDLEIFTFGHAGDGNIHMSLCSPSPDNPERVDACLKEIFTLVLSMGGTISGEHGIGSSKKKFLPMELSAENIRLQRGVKALFDPNMILNPGKIFPDTP